MATCHRYRSQEALTTAEAVALAGRLPDLVPGFAPALGERRIETTLHGERIPDLGDLPGFELGHFSLTGSLGKPGPGTFDTFREVLSRAGEPVGRLGLFQVSMGFEEKSSKQNARGFDTVLAGFRAGEHGVSPWFGYSSNGSRFTTDKPYAREVLGRVIEQLELPLSIRDEGGSWWLEHRDGGYLFVSRTRGPGGACPGVFRCAWPGADAARLVDAMESFLALCASPKRFAPEWRAAGLPGGDERVPAAREILAALHGAALPHAGLAHGGLELQATLFADDLASLEVLRRLSGAGDETLTPLGTAGEPGVSLAFATTADGHRLDLESRVALGPAEWGSRLNLSLEEWGGGRK
ncbi:MAG TPA: hypothetical protein VF017_12225 [Thermoanaerobaculia bacterium]|nr:hypothetical protein [Thermoanaerobaculia bacterium]